MKKEQLKVLGINLKQDISMHDLLSENFNGKFYGLTNRQLQKINVLRSMITEYNRNIPINTKIQLTEPGIVAEILRPIYKGLGHEECWVLYLDRANQIINKEMISFGSICGTIIDKKMIVRKAILHSASSIILSHNHPSNNPHPGESDTEATESLKNALLLLDIQLTDHIIISDSSYYSFAYGSAFKYII